MFFVPNQVLMHHKVHFQLRLPHQRLMLFPIVKFHQMNHQIIHQIVHQMVLHYHSNCWLRVLVDHVDKHLQLDLGYTFVVDRLHLVDLVHYELVIHRERKIIGKKLSTMICFQFHLLVYFTIDFIRYQIQKSNQYIHQNSEDDF